MKYSLKPSQMVTTLGAYATAPITSVLPSMVSQSPLKSEQRQAAHRLADEIVEHVRGRPHHRCGAGIAKMPLDPDLLAKRRAAAHAHRGVGDRERSLCGARLDLQHAQRRS